MVTALFVLAIIFIFLLACVWLTLTGTGNTEEAVVVFTLLALLTGGGASVLAIVQFFLA